MIPARLQIGRSDSFWQSLRYFSIYRLIVAAVLLAALMWYGVALHLGSDDARLFRWVAIAYFIAAAAMLGIVQKWRQAFDLQLSAQVACDIVALTLLMHASGGAKSGIGVMIFVVLAGAGLVGQGRMTLFYAALATLAMLFEQAYRVVQLSGDPSSFFQAGLTSIGYFGTAIVARLLARRVVANEELARRRGVELAHQLQLNQRVIRDMQDGVLVVDGAGRIRQHNPQAEAILGSIAAAGMDLGRLAPDIAEQYQRWLQISEETSVVFARPQPQTTVRARFLPPGEGGLALIYLEDMGRIQAQAQQLKLAALGRLTANIAHEIRNPLAAISHAAELLADEDSANVKQRLVGIIGDNSGRINRLVAEVMELGRRDRASIEEIDLPVFVRQFAEEWSLHDADAATRIELDIEVDTMLRFDRGHLHRVLSNLIGNALRHASGVAGAVRVVGRRGARPESVELHVIDDGPGIGESLRGQVFEPFFTTHARGTGLGLYIARELCDANGALLELTDQSPGAHFRVVGKGGIWKRKATVAAS